MMNLDLQQGSLSVCMSVTSICHVCVCVISVTSVTSFNSIMSVTSVTSVSLSHTHSLVWRVQSYSYLNKQILKIEMLEGEENIY